MPNSPDILFFSLLLQISLVEFILDNYIKIFGVDISPGFENAIPSNSNETSPDTQNNFIEFDKILPVMDHETCYTSERTCPKRIDTVPRIPPAPSEKGGLLDKRSCCTYMQ